MKIQRIALNNFGSYENLNTFDFAEEDADKRVVVIGGKNGAGKTTLFTAIQVCLYGNFAFGYKTSGKIYLKDIFKLLNSNARLDETKSAYIEIAFSQEDHTDICEYVIRRAWTWQHNEVVEHLTVLQDGIVLDEAELANFQNFLLHLIPPDMLKLYFFDGEKIADYFLKDQEINFRDAIMVLSGNDTFDIIFENVRRIMKASEDGETDAADSYLSAKERYTALQQQMQQLEEEANAYATAIEDATAELDRLQREYKAQGGVSLEAWGVLHEKLKEEEVKRDRLNTQRRLWATEYLPFLMIENLLNQVLTQIESEKKHQSYSLLKESLEDIDFLRMLTSVARKIGAPNPRNGGSELLSSIQGYLLDSSWEQFKPLLGLSGDEEFQTVAAIKKVTTVDREIGEKINARIEQSLEQTKQIRAQIQASDVDHFEEYVQNTSRLENEKLSASVSREQTLARIETLRIELSEQESLVKKLKKMLEEHLKKQSVASISGRLLMLLEDLQEYIYSDLIKKVEADLNQKFRQLLRKKDFFSRIVINHDFSIHILRDQDVSREDLVALTQSPNRAPLVNAIGEHAADKLMAQLNVHTISELNAMLRMGPADSYHLPVTIDKQRLSSGEKQIFVMALYWSMMHQSKSSLPYIIDTPFARIDTEHRANIINHFFKELSGQLIVLSTDEEISNRHLRDMENQISSVYMLDYGSDKRTRIHKNQYFEVVS